MNSGYGLLLGMAILCVIVFPAQAQPEDLADAAAFLRAHPPKIGYQQGRKACFDLLDREFKAREGEDEEIKEFYDSMLEHMVHEIKAPHTGQARIIKMYNHGFILDLQEITIAFDLVHGMNNWDLVPNEVLELVDIHFISHRHGDHFDAKLLNSAMDLGSEVVIPAEMDVWPVIEMEAGDSLHMLGLDITAHYGLHSVPVRVYEVTTPGGLKILHTGDNQDSYTLPLLEGLDIMLLNSWVNESVGENSNVVGMFNCLQKLHPDLMIPGHCNELRHPPEQRYAYDSVFHVMELDTASDILVMAWGEKYIYRPGSVIQLFHTSTPPLIDGNRDSCWVNSEPISMEKRGMQTPDDWNDLSACFRTMWDQSNLYFMIEVKDDQIRNDHADISQIDAVELYFSGNGEEMTHMQFGYGKDPLNAPGASYAFRSTVSGYLLEVSLPASSLPFDFQSDSLFSFDIQVSDNDSGTLDSHLRWWCESDSPVADPGRIGLARLLSNELSYAFSAAYVPYPLKIDGYKDDAWSGKIMYSVNNCVAGREKLSSPVDARVRWNVLWDQNYLYLWMEIDDDHLINDHDQGAYQDDCVELWIDGDNSKGTAHDGIDDRCFQFRYREGSDPELSQAEGPPIALDQVKYSSRVNGSGWILEAAFPLADLGISPFDSTKFGLDLDYNDDDDGGERDSKLKYYGTVDEAWVSPGLWGTGILLGSGSAADSTGAVREESFSADHSILQCYPNPFQEFLSVSVSMPMGKSLQVEVYDLQGRILRSRTVSGHDGQQVSLELDLSDLENGLFLVSCTSKGHSWRKKVVKYAP